MKNYDEHKDENPELMDLIMKPHRVKVVEMLNQSIVEIGSIGLKVAFGITDRELCVITDNPESRDTHDLIFNSILTLRTRKNLISIGFVRLLIISYDQTIADIILRDIPD